MITAEKAREIISELENRTVNNIVSALSDFIAQESSRGLKSTELISFLTGKGWPFNKHLDSQKILKTVIDIITEHGFTVEDNEREDEDEKEYIISW